MTTIAIDPVDLRHAGKLFIATAEHYRGLARSLSAQSTAGVVPSLQGQVSAEVHTIKSDLESMAIEVQSEGRGLLLIAEFIEESEREGHPAVQIPGDTLQSLFTSFAMLGEFARQEGLSEASAARLLMGAGDETDEFLASLPEIGAKAQTLGLILNFVLVYDETGDYVEAAARTVAAWGGGVAGGAAAGYTCGVVFGWTGVGLVLCVGAGAMAGGYLGDKAAKGLMNQTYLGTAEWRLAKAQTESGLLPIEEKIRDLEARSGLEEARAALAQEYEDAGLSPEEARERAEFELPDYGDAQLSP